MTLSKLSWIYHGLLAASLATVLMSLAGCDRGKSGLVKYTVETKQKIFSEPMKSSMTDFTFPVKTSYSSASLRSPFDEATAPTVTQEGKVGSPLTGYMLSSLRFVGTITENGKISGIILTPTNKVFNVFVGDLIGSQNGKIVNIYRDRIEVTEQIREGNAPVSQRLVTLQLKEKD